jgi:hypothetical protein
MTVENTPITNFSVRKKIVGSALAVLATTGLAVAASCAPETPRQLSDGVVCNRVIPSPGKDTFALSWTERAGKPGAESVQTTFIYATGALATDTIDIHTKQYPMELPAQWSGNLLFLVDIIDTQGDIASCQHVTISK